MTLSPSLFLPHPSSISTSLFKSNSNANQFIFPTKAPKISIHRRFLSGYWILPSDSPGKARAKTRELILGNPSVTVEKGKYSYDVETLINKLSSLPPRGSIARCLEIFKSKLSLNDFALVFKEFAQRGDWQRSLRLFKYMQRQIWCKPNEHIYTIMISLLGREGLLEKCSEIFEEMPSHGVARTVFSYTAVINAYGRNGQYHTALELLDRMKKEMILPSVLTYNTVINACARGGLDWEGLLGLFAEMRHEGVQPDLVTYNTLLSACASRSLGDEAEMVFRTMNEGGIVPDITTYSHLVETFGKLGKLEKVSELLKEMESGGNLPDIMSYNILIQVFGEGGYFKEVVTLFHDMVEENIEPDMETYEGLIFACGKGGLQEDAEKILLKMNEKGIVPSSKAYTGVIEAYGQAALYEEALVAFNTMNEVGSSPTVETYNSLIHTFARGGLYKECEVILFRMGESGVARNVDSFNGIIEAFRQGGQFEEAVKAYIEMEKARCDPDERTLEVVLSVYCIAGLVDESVEQFQEIKATGTLPSVMCYCMMLAVYAKSDRWDDAYELLDEMLTNKVSSIHQVTGQMIKGDYDDDSNWQMVEYVFDKLNSEGCGLGMRFYNTLLEALWWLGQKERAARVLNEASKRGLFPELFRYSKHVWSVDVHRMWEGGAYTAISLWLNNMYEMFMTGEDLPQLASVIVVRGRMEKSSITRDFPVAKAAYSFLQDKVSTSFSFAGWNKGRIVCQRSQLKRILSESSSDAIEKDKIVDLRNSPFNPSGTRTSKNDVKSSQNKDATIIRKQTELVPSTV
ncbi:hypothetical protein I3760_11G033600 [Carya illinoinensis]|uniref:Smr domain-containing protein n=1 Tax=Carya illinoinensis TaxID=32201 RepID=A0A922DLX9_CARIL|nr:hypothetical protein I3760_11G033600 [Carya illinoinensis]KAG6686702.1 hypothetical protein I3842_11G033800 [Carya illinoinensis]